jgi:hypothetical protein
MQQIKSGAGHRVELMSDASGEGEPKWVGRLGSGELMMMKHENTIPSELR